MRFDTKKKKILSENSINNFRTVSSATVVKEPFPFCIYEINTSSMMIQFDKIFQKARQLSNVKSLCKLQNTKDK